MRHGCTIRLALGVGLFLGQQVMAQDSAPEPRSRPTDSQPTASPYPVCPVPLVDQFYQAKRLKLVEEQHLIAKPRLEVREEIADLPTLGIEVEYKEEKQSVTVMVPKPREEQHLVTSMVCLPEVVLDPHTGCPHTIQKQVPVTKIVKTTVFDLVPEKREVLIRVPVCKPSESMIRVKRLVLQESTAPTIVKQLRLLETPVDIHYKAPVYPLPCLEPPSSCPSCGTGH